MNCSCVYVDYGQNIDIIKQETRISATNHKCSECNEKIALKEKFEHTRYKFDGKFGTHKICSTCMDLREIFFCNGYGVGALRQDLFQHIKDSGGVISSDCIKSLNPEARNVVFEMIEEAWDN